MQRTNLVKTITEWAEHVGELVLSAQPAELMLAAILPLLALLIGIRINSWIDAKPNKTISAKVLDFTAPLLSPMLAIIFVALTAVMFVHFEYTPKILPFIFKLCVAWLAVHIVIIMSSGRTAGLFIAFVILPVTLLHMFGVWTPLVAVARDVQFTIGDVKLNLYAVAKAIVAIILLIWITNFTLDITENRLKRVKMRSSSRTLIMKFAQIVLYVLVFLVGMRMLGVSLTTLSIFGGALGVGIGFGLQKIASNFISGIILLFERSVEVGDVITLEDGTTGTIKHTGARYTMIATANGAEVLVPNENFITQQVTSATLADSQGQIEMKFRVGLETDLDAARELLLDVAKAHKRVLKDPAPTCFVTEITESAINMSLFVWVDDIQNGTFATRSELLIAGINAFRANSVVIPYPHQVAVLPEQVGEKFIAPKKGKGEKRE